MFFSALKLFELHLSPAIKRELMNKNVGKRKVKVLDFRGKWSWIRISRAAHLSVMCLSFPI